MLQSTGNPADSSAYPNPDESALVRSAATKKRLAYVIGETIVFNKLYV